MAFFFLLLHQASLHKRHYVINHIRIFSTRLSHHQCKVSNLHENHIARIYIKPLNFHRCTKDKSNNRVSCSTCRFFILHHDLIAQRIINNNNYTSKKIKTNAFRCIGSCGDCCSDISVGFYTEKSSILIIPIADVSTLLFARALLLRSCRKTRREERERQEF